jgi:hypothetical protein
VSYPEVRVKFVDHVAKTWGQPYGALAVGMEFRPFAW